MLAPSVVVSTQWVSIQNRNVPVDYRNPSPPDVHLPCYNILTDYSVIIIMMIFRIYDSIRFFNAVPHKYRADYCNADNIFRIWISTKFTANLIEVSSYFLSVFYASVKIICWNKLGYDPSNMLIHNGLRL